ncbi:hemin uptake protein HemP [Microvirga tunisiensis]|uniref:Hemin uptake protein HemP n=3 Tax=Pannonibacter tanglangensis TaxID=2750084 RepID=A0ABW9ZIB1_9HYPH|nr:hemin uptake protein HemP [Pannonibacter sp. XCT-34]NBN79145.1 hemin uptake protein HemP [Pannonibacter sp. XCT-53]
MLPTLRKVAQPREDKSLVDSAALFAGNREIRIRHNDETYRLTITKLGKLILTK